MIVLNLNFSSFDCFFLKNKFNEKTNKPGLCRDEL